MRQTRQMWGAGGTSGRRLSDEDLSKAAGHPSVITAGMSQALTPKSAQPVNATPASAKPTTTLGLKKPSAAPIAKAYRSWDPESARVRRQSVAQGAGAVGGAALAHSGYKMQRDIHPDLKHLHDEDTRVRRFVGTRESTNRATGKVTVQERTLAHPKGERISADALKSTMRMTRAAKTRVGVGGAAIGGAAMLRRFTNSRSNRQYL